MIKTNTKQIEFILFSILMVSLPFSKAAASTSMVLLFILMLLKWKNSLREIRKYPAIAIISLLFFLHIPGLLSSQNFSEALSFMNKQIAYLLLPLIIIANIELIKSRGLKLIHFFIVSCGITSLITLLFFVLPENWVIQISENVPMLNIYEKTVNRVSFGIYSPFIDRLHFSYLLAIALMFVVWDFIKQKRTVEYYYYVPIIVNFVLLGGRGAQLASLILVIIWLAFLYIQKRKQKINYLAIVGIMVGGLFVLPYLTYQLVPPVKKRYDQMFWELKLIKSGEYKSWNYEHFTTLRRLLSIKHHYTLIKQSPWLGVGVGDYRTELRKAYDQDEDLGLNLSPNANNQYLFYWANSGILSLLLFFFVLYYWTKSSLHQVAALVDKTLIISFLIFLLFILMFDVFIIYQIGIMSVSLFMSFIFLLTRAESTLDS